MAKKSTSKMNKIVDIIQDKIKSNEEILKLLYYADDSDIDIYKQPQLSLPETLKTVKEKILTYRKVFKDEDACAYMILKYGEKTYHHENNIFFNGNTFDIYVLCHDSLAVNKYVGNIVNEIESRIEDLFDTTIIDNISCLTTVSYSEAIEVNNFDYSGRHIQLVFHDHNDKMKDRLRR